MKQFFRQWREVIAKAEARDDLLRKQNGASGFGGLATFLAICFGWVVVILEKFKKPDDGSVSQ